MVPRVRGTRVEGKRKMASQPTVQTTLKSRRTQTKVNDMSVPSFVPFRLSHTALHPSHSVSHSVSPGHVPTPVNGRQRDNRSPDRPQIARSFVPLLVGLAWGRLTKLGRRSHIAHFSHFDGHRALGETEARHLDLWNNKNRKPASQSLPKRGIWLFQEHIFLELDEGHAFWIRW